MSKLLVNTPLRGQHKDPAKTIPAGAVIEIADEDEAKSLVDSGAVSVVPAVEADGEAKPAKTTTKK